MSILSALKQQNGSIDDLAKLPQALIMQMAQKGDIRQDMLAPILARKAELAQAVANTKAMQQQGSQVPPTVMEQIMNQNAMAEVPESSRDIGVAQLPVREGMYSPQSMAGGGIVAFVDNPNQPVSSDMPTRPMTDEERQFLEENEYLKRSRAVANFGKNLKETFTNPENYNPISLYQKNIGQPFAEGVNRFINADMNKTFRTGQQARTGEIPMFVGNEPTTKGKLVAEGKMKPNENVVDVLKKQREQKQLNQDFENFDKATELFVKEQKGKVPTKAGNVNPQPVKKPPVAKVEPAKEEEPLYSKYEKMLMDEREAAKTARQDAKWARMLEAGLGIAGGTSQYWQENLRQGALPALKGYGEDVKGLRSEERARVKDLLGIEGMRQEAKRSAEDLGIKRQMLDVQRLAATKPDSTSQIIGLGRKAGMNDREIMGMLSGAAKDPDISARNILMKAYFESPMLQGKHKTLDDFLKSQGIGAGAGGQAPLNYVPGKGVV
jgi:hypothetical protein